MLEKLINFFSTPLVKIGSESISLFWIFQLLILRELGLIDAGEDNSNAIAWVRKRLKIKLNKQRSRERKFILPKITKNPSVVLPCLVKVGVGFVRLIFVHSSNTAVQTSSVV